MRLEVIGTWLYRTSRKQGGWGRIDLPTRILCTLKFLNHYKSNYLLPTFLPDFVNKITVRVVSRSEKDNPVCLRCICVREMGASDLSNS